MRGVIVWLMIAIIVAEKYVNCEKQCIYHKRL